MANITAARINNLQNRISLVYGQGAGQSGYGQTLVSSQVSSLDSTVQAADLNNIYTDILNARVHQVGAGGLASIPIDTVLAGSNTVAEDTSAYVDPEDGTLSNDPTGFKKGIADYECFQDDPYTLMYGCMWVCFSVASWLFTASYLEMPV